MGFNVSGVDELVGSSRFLWLTVKSEPGSVVDSSDVPVVVSVLSEAVVFSAVDVSDDSPRDGRLRALVPVELEVVDSYCNLNAEIVISVVVPPAVTVTVVSGMESVNCCGL